MSRPVVLTAAVLCALAAIPFGRFLLADRDLVAATPSPRAVFTVSFIDVRPGQDLCIDGVTIPTGARQIRFQVRTFERPGPPLLVALRAGTYSETTEVPAGYADGTTLAHPITPPATTAIGEVCVTNRGEDPIALVGTTEERTESRPTGAVNGRPVDPDAYLAFYEDRSASALSQTAAIVDRMAAFRPGVIGPWLLWPTLVLVAVGVPAGVLWAALRAARA